MTPDEQVDLCEFIGCNRQGWVVLHWGPKLTPPLRVACHSHQSADDLSMFQDRRAKS